MNPTKLHIALPLMDELDMIPEIISCLNSQSNQNFDVYICVNQPDKWWSMPEKDSVCISNANTIEYLKKINNPKIRLIDKSSPGMGWANKKDGAGWARKIIMDEICIHAGDQDLIVSLDGDTLFGKYYFESVATNFYQSGNYFSALTVPYYHKLTGNQLTDRALLRYEIYMRYYLINMLRIKSPYSFTALGSAMVVPVWAYKGVSGITPVKNGEDFYFLQKLRKYRPVLTWNAEKVFPSGRLSDRVDFGTGPALKAGILGNWKSYPIYHPYQFDKVKETFDLFPELFKQNVDTPMTDFLTSQFKSDDIWQPLRNNYNDISRFIHACECKVDGLRILQYLRSSFDSSQGTDESRLLDFMEKHYSAVAEFNDSNLRNLSFEKSSPEMLNRIRDVFVDIEDSLRQEHDKALLSKL